MAKKGTKVARRGRNPSGRECDYHGGSHGAAFPPLLRYDMFFCFFYYFTLASIDAECTKRHLLMCLALMRRLENLAGLAKFGGWASPPHDRP